MGKRLQSFAWLLLLVTVIGWFFHESLWGGRSLVPSDLLHQIVLPFGVNVKDIDVKNHYTFDCLTADYPYAVVWEKSVKSGEWPLWNPMVLGGHPYLAANMQAALNPFRLLGLFLTPERAMTLGFVLEFLLASVFMFAFLRELDRSAPAAFIGSCAFGLNSMFVMWYWRVPSTFAWAPLILLLYERSIRRDSWNYLLAAAMVLGVACLSGNMQAFSHLTFLCGVYAVGVSPWRGSQERKQSLARVVILLAVALLLAAVQLLPTLELMREGATNALTKTRLLHPGIKHTVLGIPLLVTFVFPSLAGSPETFDVMKVIGATMGDFSGYIGIVPFALFCVGAFAVRERAVKVLLAAGGGVLIIVFFTPLLTLVYHRFFIAIVFGEAVLAAYGLDAVLDTQGVQAAIVRRVWKWMLGLCITAAVLLVVGQIAISLNHQTLVHLGQQYVLRNAGQTIFANRQQWLLDRVPKFFDQYRLTNVAFGLPILALAAACVCYFRYAAGKLRRSVFVGVLVTLTVCDLTMMGHQWLPQIDLQRYPLNPPLPLLNEPRSDPGLFRVYQWTPGKWWILPNSLLTPYGLASIGANESLSGPSLEALSNNIDGKFTPLLDLQNVKYVIVDATVMLPPNRFDLVAEEGGVRLYRNRACLPRALFVPGIRVIGDRKQIPDVMLSPTFDPRNVVVLEREPEGLGTNTGDGMADITRYEAQQVVVRVRATRPGMLVLADTWYPGWQARLDHRPVTLYRADYVLRGVVVPAGEHEVEFDFRPATFRIGATVTLITLLGLTLYAGSSMLRRRHRII
jgi:hypothetical protein